MGQIGCTSEHLRDPQRRCRRLLVLARGVFPAVIDAFLLHFRSMNLLMKENWDVCRSAPTLLHDVLTTVVAKCATSNNKNVDKPRLEQMFLSYL